MSEFNNFQCGPEEQWLLNAFNKQNHISAILDFQTKRSGTSYLQYLNRIRNCGVNKVWVCIIMYNGNMYSIIWLAETPSVY